MDKRIELQSVTRVSDSQGGYTETWATYATVWAEIKPVKGYEKFQAMQNATPVTHNLVIRYRSGVTTAHRVLFGSRVFHIKEVLNIEEANSFLRIAAIEMA